MKKIVLDYDKKLIKFFFYLTVFMGILACGILPFINLSDTLIKIYIVFIFLILLSAISFGVTLFSNKPYVVITNETIEIDRKRKLRWKEIKSFKHNKTGKWIKFSTDKPCLFLGIKTNFLTPGDEKKLLQEIEKNCK